MGEEIEAGQGRGEIATQEGGRPVSVPDGNTSPATLEELGFHGSSGRKEAAGYKAPISPRSTPPSSAPAAWASSSTS